MMRTYYIAYSDRFKSCANDLHDTVLPGVDPITFEQIKAWKEKLAAEYGDQASSITLLNVIKLAGEVS